MTGDVLYNIKGTTEIKMRIVEWQSIITKIAYSYLIIECNQVYSVNMIGAEWVFWIWARTKI